MLKHQADAMAGGETPPAGDIFINLHQVEEDVERSPFHEGEEEEEEEELAKALSVERFGDLIECSSQGPTKKMGRSYNEKDFEFHRHTSHHIHHPLSSHLPVSFKLKKLTHINRKKKKKQKKKKTSVPPSQVTPTIQEVDEEEDEESETEMFDMEASTSSDALDTPVLCIKGNEEEVILGFPLDSVQMETEQTVEVGIPTDNILFTADEGISGMNTPSSSRSRGMPGTTAGSWEKTKQLHQLLSGQRNSYDLKERMCIGSRTAQDNWAFQRFPTDEAEAKMLASADLDDMKSHRFEDNPGVRRHLVKKPSRNQLIRSSKTSEIVSSIKKKKKKPDKKPHEVFVELNELMMNKNQEMQWRETARWIKFEEDVEKETDRWGKPHVASLSFRSLLELRKTIAHGAVLLDLEQTTLPGIAHLVVETMIISDQIKAEDRANVLRALLLKHSHPNDEKEAFFPRNHSTSSLNSVLGNHQLKHTGDTQIPLMGEEKTVMPDAQNLENKEKSLHRQGGEPHRNRTLKLLEKIPENAEATVVLVGCVEFLEQPAMAFVRLNESVFLESVLEVPIPVRFIFVLLGPSQSNMDYHEIGRSLSTLMSDKHFHEVAYSADDRQDLLNAINEFLDASIVIPPSEVEGKDLLKSVASFQKEMLRKRKERELRRMMKDGLIQEAKDLSDEKKVEAEGSDDDPLKRTGIVFGGLVQDIKRRYPKYLSDITDALHSQCIAAGLFIYFAALSPTITFGGLLGEKTHGLMGVSEMIVSTSVLGILFSILGAQPLLVIGFSGPLLVFEEAFYKFCHAQDIEYLTGRVWIGLWLVVIVFVIVAVEGSFLVRYISPFTQEIFAFLISLIFIYETFYKLYKVFTEHPLLKSYPSKLQPSWKNKTASPDTVGYITEKMQPNTALLSLVLMLGTFLIAFFMRKFKNSRFLGGKVRRIIGDFGIPIAILLMVLVDHAITDTYLQKLNVPSGLSVTSPDKRGWFINPLGQKQPFPLWLMFASVIPALLVFILIFMETQITALIVSKKERKLMKGSGFHLDLLLIGTMGGVCALFGLPWLTAATVRTVTHVNALTVMNKAIAPGEKPKIKEVKEQRMTGMLVAVLVGLSIEMGSVLRQIPLAVLFGIFLYMGVTSLTGIQLYERLLLMFTPSKHHPDHVYVIKVKTWRMNLFTIIQLACIVILWVVKSTVASLAFPFVLIMTVPLRRFMLPRIFEERELKALDSDDAEPNFDEDGRDEYNELHMPV